MTRDRVGYLFKKRSAAAALIAAISFGCLDTVPAQAQMMMRGFGGGGMGGGGGPMMGPRFNPGIGGGADFGGRGAGLYGGRFLGRAPYVDDRYITSIPEDARIAPNGLGRRNVDVTRIRPARRTANSRLVMPAEPRTPMARLPSSGKETKPDRTRPVIIAVTPRVPVLWPTIPYVRYAPNLYPECTSRGECRDRPVFIAAGNGGVGGPPLQSQNSIGPRRNASQAAIAPRTVADEIVAEIDGTLSDAQADALARRYRLTRVGSQNFPLIGSTIALFRISDRRSVESVRALLSTDPAIRATQPNFRYLLSDQKTAPASEGDPAQYALAKLRLPEAHRLAHGANVTVAVIDSAIDLKHPELANAIADSFDALGSKEGPHVHGTGIAGAIVSHARLMGSAPSAKILAIQAFGAAPGGAESTSFVILKALDYAASHRAQVVNMSFAGPNDPLIERAVAAVADKGIVMVAASGNAGPKSPPLYPAANANVIAVSATDAYDKLFPASNRGSHIAVAAPGVDIFLPAPDEKYQMTSGTSFSAAYISGLAALMMERNPALKPADVRAILMKTARDLGAPGRDDLFGAGEADAFSAVAAVVDAAGPVAAAAPDAGKVSADAAIVSATRPLDQPAAMATDKPATE